MSAIEATISIVFSGSLRNQRPSAASRSPIAPAVSLKLTLSFMFVAANRLSPLPR